MCTFSDSPGDAVIVVDYYVFGGSWFDCPFFIACLRVITLTALQTAGVFLSSLLPCFVYGAGSTPDSNYNSRCTGSQRSVAASWLVVGTDETPMLYTGGGGVFPVCKLINLLCAFVSCAVVWKRSCFPTGYFVFFMVFGSSY